MVSKRFQVPFWEMAPAPPPALPPGSPSAKRSRPISGVQEATASSASAASASETAAGGSGGSLEIAAAATVVGIAEETAAEGVGDGGGVAGGEHESDEEEEEEDTGGGTRKGTLFLKPLKIMTCESFDMQISIKILCHVQPFNSTVQEPMSFFTCAFFNSFTDELPFFKY